MNYSNRDGLARVAQEGPAENGIGVELDIVDVRQLDDASFAVLHRQWLDHSVLLIRNQHLDNAELIAFSRLFGELDWAPIQETGRRFVDGMPRRFEVATGDVRLSGAVVEISPSMGRAEKIELLTVR